METLLRREYWCHGYRTKTAANETSHQSYSIQVYNWRRVGIMYI